MMMVSLSIGYSFFGKILIIINELIKVYKYLAESELKLNFLRGIYMLLLIK